MAKKYVIRVDLDLSKAKQQADQLGNMLARAEGRAGTAIARHEREAARARQRDVEAENRKAQQIESIAIRAQLRDEARRRNYQQRKSEREAREAERDAARLERIQDQFLRRDYRNRVRYEAMKQREADRAAEQHQARVAMLATVGIGLAVAATRQVAAMYREIEQRATEAAARVTQAKLQLREEAAIVGAPMVTDQLLLDSLRFRATTGLGDRESTDFRRQYLGSVNIGRQKFDLSGGKEGISQGVADQLMVEAGKRAARIGGDAGTAGELAGLIAQFGPVKSVEQGMGQLEAIRMALTEGRGDDTPLTRELLQASGALVGEGGAVPTLPEMAALIGTTSLATGPQGAATRAEQAVRGMRFGLLKERKIKGADMSQAAYLKSIDVTADSTFEQSLDKVYADVVKNSSVEQADIYLGQKGFRNVEEVRALQQLLKNYSVFKARMEKSRAPGQGKAAMDANTEYLTNTPEGRMAVADATKLASDAATGVKVAGLEAGVKEAEASPDMQASDRSITGMLGDYVRGAMEFGGPETGRRRRLVGKALDDAKKRAFAAGMTRDQYFQAQTRAQIASKGDTGMFSANMYNELQAFTAGRGGATAADPTAALNSLEAAIRANTEALNRQKGGAVPPPVRVPANQGNLNP